jgi:hypothetical protein
MSKNNELKVKQLLDAMKSGNEVSFSKAINNLNVVMTPALLPELVSLIQTTQSPKNRFELIQFFNDLATDGAQEIMMQTIFDPSYIDLRHELLSTIWNSRIDYSNFLAEFVEIASEGNYLEALECLTIIENLDGPFEEADILEAQLHLKEYLESTTKTDEKSILMSEIALLIKNMNEELADFDIEEMD